MTTETSRIPMGLRLGGLGVLALAMISEAQPAKGANKFLGNITSRGQVRSDFGTFWNQITGENEHKWSSVEGSRDNMNWGGGDRVANYAKTAGIPWKFHTLVWGSQYPNWMTGLSQADQLAEITEWFDASKAKYPDLPMIDVVNEAMPGHAPPPFKNALGGDGTTGYDWIIKAFQMARERWPDAILIYNDFNNVEYNNDINWTIGLVKKMLEVKAPIDAIGMQCHDAWRINSASLKSNLDKLADLGIPLFVTELDIQHTDDTQQLNVMREQFPIFWNHPSVVGVTYWGYIVGETWRNGTGLMQSNGTQRPAMAWMLDYVKQNPNPPNKFPGFVAGQTGVGIGAPYARQRFQAGRGRRLQVFDLQGREIRTAFGGSRPQSGSLPFPVSGAFVADDGAKPGILNAAR